MVRSALSVPSLRFDFAAGQLPVSLLQDSVSGVSLEVPGTSASRDGPRVGSCRARCRARSAGTERRLRVENAARRCRHPHEQVRSECSTQEAWIPPELHDCVADRAGPVDSSSLPEPSTVFGVHPGPVLRYDVDAIDPRRAGRIDDRASSRVVPGPLRATGKRPLRPSTYSARRRALERSETDRRPGPPSPPVGPERCARSAPARR